MTTGKGRSMDPSHRLTQGGASDQRERRKSARIPLLRHYPYELSKIAGNETVEFTEGITLSLNISSGGMLLLMPWAPAERKPFELQTLFLTEGGRGRRLVEVCWTRELPVGVDVGVYLVGVRFLFDIPASSDNPDSSIRSLEA